MEYKGVLPRVFALFIDMFVTSFLYIFVAYTYVIVINGIPFDMIFDYLQHEFVGGGVVVILQQPGVVFTIINILTTLLYFILLEAGGGTLGKRLLGMRVVDEQGRSPGFGKSLGRNLLRFIDFLPAFYILGGIVVLSSKKKQRLGDKAAGTYVVSARSAR